MAEFRLLYVLNFGNAESGRAEETVRDRLACRRLVTAFNGVFHGGDPVRLIVLCIDKRDIPIVNAWVARAAQTNGYGDPPRIEVHFGGEVTDEQVDGAIHFRPDTDYTEEGLFRAFEEQQQRQKATPYEADVVTDIYDLDRISEVRRFAPDFEGSVYANAKVRPKYPEVLAFLAQRGGRAHVLDLGCGAGAFYGLLQRWSRATGNVMPGYLGIDYSRTAILRARRAYPEAHFRWGSVTAVDAWAGQYDLAVGTSVFPFVDPEGQLVGLEKALAACNGHLFTGVPTRVEGRYPAAPAIRQQLFLDGRALPSNFSDHGEVMKILARYPQTKVESSRGIVAFKRTNVPEMYTRVDIELDVEAALLAQGLSDAQVTDALRARYGLTPDEGPFEICRLALWPPGADALPPAPGLPVDLHAEDWSAVPKR